MRDPGRTLVEKAVARAAGLDAVRAGEIVTVGVDLAFGHDGSGLRLWRRVLERLGVGLWDPDKVAIATDHYVPAADPASAAMLAETRQAVRDYGVRRFFDLAGIMHLVIAERGLVQPGMMVAGGDSHSPMAGAFGAYAAGYGATDMAAIAATGETWLGVPGTIRTEWSGELGRGVVAKDVMLRLCRALGLDNAFLAIEYAGPMVEAMTMEERMVLCNMAAELGCETGVVAADATTFAYLRDRGAPVADEAAALAGASDPDASFVAVHRFGGGELAPQIAAPHSPANSADAGEFRGQRIDQAYIGACMGAKLDDLRCAAELLEGRRIAPGVRLLVAPASAEVTRGAIAEGTMTILLDAGASLLASGCGACAGLGGGVLSDGETCLSSTNRNFRGRMGGVDARVFLGSPYSVAAAAVAGHIVDPRELLAHG